jgi:three-Cys-motif partner protein
MESGELDVVGPWTEVKLAILRAYLKPYTDIMAAQPLIRGYAYIDGFAGAGEHVSRETGQKIEGSPAIALRVPFAHYHFIDMDGERAQQLRRLAGDRKDVTVHQGNCNEVLLTEVFPLYRYEDRRRALCLLDPYGLNPDWRVVETAGRMRSIEILLSFMIVDANRNALWDNPARVRPEQAARMTAFWGDESWRKVAYQTDDGLFGPMTSKQPNKAVVTAYCHRLKEVGGFKCVEHSSPLRNRTGAELYYLVFASRNETGAKIVRAVFKKHTS